MLPGLDDPRLESLASLLTVGEGLCPFVVGGSSARLVTLAHYRGGPDATYVVVARRDRNVEANGVAATLSVTIGYAPFVEGTAIIYDLSAGQMQGKARPFDCDLGQRTNRVYAVLPYQIERVSAKIDRRRRPRSVEIAFLDARGEPLCAALPFQWRCLQGQELLASGFHSTNIRGLARLQLPENLSGVTDVFVRSLLTGLEESAASRDR